MPFNMKLILLLLIGSSAQAVRLGMNFDAEGRLIGPDEYLLLTGLKAHHKNRDKDALWRFEEAAQFGNKHAMFYAGVLQLKAGDYITGYAWLMLAGEGIVNNDQLLPAVQVEMTPAMLTESTALLAKLKQQYNVQSAIDRRIKWKKSLTFTGSIIRGHVPVGYTMSLPHNKVLSAPELRERLDDFVFEYKYDLGHVKLGELDLIEDQ